MSRAAPVRVFIVAPTPTLRTGLRSMLADRAGEAGTGLGEGAVEVVGAAAGLSGADAALYDADVVLVADEEIPDELSFALSEDGTQSVVLLSGDGEAVAALRAAGAAGLLRGWGVLAPDAPPEELGAAVLAAAQGLVVLPKDLSERFLEAPSAVGEPSEPDEPNEPLTPREREVLGLLGRGFSNRLVARELHISEHTVKFHVSSLYAKLGVAGRAGAVAEGARRGLISL